MTLQVGARAPEFRTVDLEGRAFVLGENRPALLVFLRHLM